MHHLGYRGHMGRAVAALLMLLLSTHAVYAQTLFETGRDGNVAAVSLTSRPNYFRGSLNFAPLIEPQSVDVFRGGIRGGDFCNFDLVATMRQTFEELPELLIDLMPLILLGIGIHFLCSTFPEQCALAKDLKNYANVMLRFQHATCHQVIEASSFGGVAASDSALAECLRSAAPTESSQAVWDRCQADRGGFIPLPNGGRGAEVDVVATILETAGVPPEDAARIQGYTGQLIIRGDGTLFDTEKTAPTETVVRTYNATRTVFAQGIAELVEAVRSGAQPTASQLHQFSVPGVPLPRAAIESVAGEPDASLRHYKAEALASSLALAKSKWDLLEDLHQLEKAVQASEMSPDQEKVARLALANFRGEIERLEALKQILEAHFKPAVEGLLEARANQLLEATAATSHAQAQRAAASRYESGQTTFGYVQ
jgi:hypothetical protein